MGQQWSVQQDRHKSQEEGVPYATEKKLIKIYKEAKMTEAQENVASFVRTCLRLLKEVEKKEEEEKRRKEEMFNSGVFEEDNGLWVEVKHIAPLIRLTERQVQRKIKKGKMRAIKVGKKYYVFTTVHKIKEYATAERESSVVYVMARVSKERALCLARAGFLSWDQAVQAAQSENNITFYGYVNSVRLARFLKRHFTLVRDFNGRQNISQSEVEILLTGDQINRLIGGGAVTYTEADWCRERGYAVFRGKVCYHSLMSFLRSNRLTSVCNPFQLVKSDPAG